MGVRVTMTGDGAFDVGPFVSEQTRVEQGRRLRNPRVRVLLEVGAELLQESLGGGIDDPFRFPTVPAVCARAALDEEFAGQDNPASSARNAYAKTWPTKARFDSDLVIYALTVPSWFAGDDYAFETVRELIDDEVPVDAVFERMAFNEAVLFEHKHFRLQVLMQALAPDVPIIREALDRMYEAITDAWARTAEGILGYYGLTLRPGLTVTDLATMLTAMAEGLGLRRLVRPGDRALMDRERGTTLLASGVFAVFTACLREEGDDRTLAAFCRETTGVTPRAVLK
ncbi:hypothetical protein ACFY36_10820 [Actinoplanes sp. NPDC000266]